MQNNPIVRAFAPASASNIGCGFDILGFALQQPGDVVEAWERDDATIEIVAIEGDDGRLPLDAARNTAGVAVRALLDVAGCRRGVNLRLHKGLPLSSGLGSSAASGVAALLAVCRLFALEVSKEVLLRCALEAERVACGSAHADNAAPCLYGGFVLIRPGVVPEVIELPVPEGLSCALVRPHVEVQTRAAREILGESVPLRDAVRQWSNVGGLMVALFRSDFSLLARCLHDAVAEPKRAPLVPGFHAAKQAAMDAGALGSSLSGSGPSVFALCRSRDEAETVAGAMQEALRNCGGVASDSIVSAVGAPGARVIDEGDGDGPPDDGSAVAPLP